MAGAELLFIVVFLLYALVILKKSKAEKKVKESSSDNRCIRIGNLIYDYDLNNFYVDGKKIQIRPQLTTLFLFFFNAPNHCITKSEVIEEMCGEKASILKNGIVVY